MARAIVRYSIDGERGNVTGNAVRSTLWEEARIGRIGTAHCEVEGAAIGDIVRALKGVLDLVENPPGGGTVDHLWICVDEPKSN